MELIRTRYHGPTNTRGSRVSAHYDSVRVVISWDHALDTLDNHKAAAKALQEKYMGEFFSGVEFLGSLGNEYIFRGAGA